MGCKGSKSPEQTATSNSTLLDAPAEKQSTGANNLMASLDELKVLVAKSSVTELAAMLGELPQEVRDRIRIQASCESPEKSTADTVDKVGEAPATATDAAVDAAVDAGVAVNTDEPVAATVDAVAAPVDAVAAVTATEADAAAELPTVADIGAEAGVTEDQADSTEVVETENSGKGACGRWCGY